MTVTPRISSGSTEGRRWWAGAGAEKSKAFIPAGIGPTARKENAHQRFVALMAMET